MLSPVQGVQKGRRLKGGFNRFLLFGFPIIAGTITGYLGIAHIVAGRSEVYQEREDRDWEIIALEKALTQEGPMKDWKRRKPTTLEEELKAIQKKVDINNFEYKSVPRPPENSD